MINVSKVHYLTKNKNIFKFENCSWMHVTLPFVMLQFHKVKVESPRYLIAIWSSPCTNLVIYLPLPSSSSQP